MAYVRAVLDRVELDHDREALPQAARAGRQPRAHQPVPDAHADAGAVDPALAWVRAHQRIFFGELARVRGAVAGLRAIDRQSRLVGDLAREVAAGPVGAGGRGAGQGEGDPKGREQAR